MGLTNQKSTILSPEPRLSPDRSLVAPRPRTIAATGLNHSYLADLVAKHLLAGGVLTVADLSKRLSLSGSIIEEMLAFLREEARVEILGGSVDITALRFGLTDRGRNFALDATIRSSYTGPAPVPLEHYAEVVRTQSIHSQAVTREMVEELFKDTVLDEGLRDQLGLSMNSGRAIFIYGPAGTGKTYITTRLAHLFGDSVLIPHAIAVGDTTIAIFDPVLHKSVELEGNTGWMLDEGYDPRFVLCKRPVVISGGELTVEMLEVQYDAATKEYLAPLQLKANNGVFIIDDMGRQRVPPKVIFNRWIVPMEEKIDYLTLGSGRHFSVPFDEALIFSTNMNPLELADEAFLRRIGYKIEFPHLTEDQYRQIWADVCSEQQIAFDVEIVNFVINELHKTNKIPLLPCHPRDLLGIAVDQTTYASEPRILTEDHLRLAWKSYFVSLSNDSTATIASTQVRGNGP